MNINVENRQAIIDALKRELVGPAPDGSPLDLQKLSFEKWEDAFGPFVDKDTGEEIIRRDRPSNRYGVAVLHPYATPVDNESTAGNSGEPNTFQEGSTLDISEKNKDNVQQSADAALEKYMMSMDDIDQEELDLTLINSFQPSSIGVSFLAEFPSGSKLIVDGTGGRYEKIDVMIAGKKQGWWVRRSVSLHAELDGDNILNTHRRKISPEICEINGQGEIDLKVEIFTHPYNRLTPDQKLITVCLVNRSKENIEENTLFQANFRVTITAEDGKTHILPYPGPEIGSLDEEEKSMQLLYRHERTFGVGHGCAAVWDYQAREEKTSWVSGECLPSIEIPSITPDILDENKREIKIPMAPLAGLVDGDDGFESLEKLILSYEDWITKRSKEINELESEALRDAGERHLKDCRYCATRMRKGLLFLRNDNMVRRAFQLANRAILFQQLRSRPEVRRWKFDEKSRRVVFPDAYEKLDSNNIGGTKGKWRAFQMAFLLSTVNSVADPEDPDRDIVELIWFPTGGGKTEAYLGLSAFSLLLRRMKDNDDTGTNILMRYTLRLLTTQQFLRAARLICALELIRKDHPQELGTKEFSIGLWVGGNNTPNTREEAKKIYKGLEKGTKFIENKFILDRCPWCSAQIGPADEEQSKKSKFHLTGYYMVGNTIAFKCSDPACEFKSGLPVYVTDDEIYEKTPSMIIGTVDKFAMLTWKPSARSLFGIDSTGNRVKSPPGLVIQDELHLISGPLGSMVGLFEGLIEELCTDRRWASVVKPKIISSTATIRRYKEQIKALYARSEACLFPPPGLHAGDSFFSKYATNPDGSNAQGRVFVGVHAPGLGSMQTVQVRTATTLLQSPMNFKEDERDPWWTLVMFFNSLRELGGALTLFQSDILDYQQVYNDRQRSEKRLWRPFHEIVELTGRANSEDIPKSISNLEKSYSPQSEQKPIDVCLASNILEVGIDIERLSLMGVVGQPKTTAQYIQVTGRVGRKWYERPGLIVTMYSASKPRDRSHFEKFISYHQKLYAQVEPTSVTPFSAPVLERALHAVLIAYIRQMGPVDIGPDPFPDGLVEKFRKLIFERIKFVDPEESETLKSILDQRIRQWKTVRPIHWRPQPGNSEDIPLMKVAGTLFEQTHGLLPLPTMQSMRSVDMECMAEIRYPAVEGDS